MGLGERWWFNGGSLLTSGCGSLGHQHLIFVLDDRVSVVECGLYVRLGLRARFCDKCGRWRLAASYVPFDVAAARLSLRFNSCNRRCVLRARLLSTTFYFDQSDLQKRHRVPSQMRTMNC